MKKHPKSINELMRYLRDKKGMEISGSSQKRKLMNIGYYHGYKGYRYIRAPSRHVDYRNFDELMAVYEFDARLKALFYPVVMEIETAFKNYVLEILIDTVRSDNFQDIYYKALDDYKRFAAEDNRGRGESAFKKALKRRLDLRNRIYKIQTDAYANENKIANHYLGRDEALPIWAIFELLSLGEFGHFVSCLNQGCRQAISRKLGIRQGDDTAGTLPQRLIYATKDLRNAVAHNDVVFDTRFKKSHIDKQIGGAISHVSGIQEIRFVTVTDYLALVIYELKMIRTPKTRLKMLIADFEDICDAFRKAVPDSLYRQVIYTDDDRKIRQLKAYAAQ